MLPLSWASGRHGGGWGSANRFETSRLPWGLRAVQASPLPRAPGRFSGCEGSADHFETLRLCRRLRN
eukprot:9471036-Pyramimonas_sp.AAC.1